MIDVTDFKKWSPKPGEMTGIEPFEVSHVSRPANKRDYLFTKSEKEDTMENLVSVAKTVELNNEPHLRQTLKSAGVEGDALEAAIMITRLAQAFDEVDLASALGVEATTTPADEPATEIDKSDLPDQVRKYMSDLEGQVNGLTKAIAEQRDRERISKFRSDLSDLSHLGDTNKIADLVKSVDDIDEDVATQLVEVLRSANEVAGNGAGDLYKSVGSAGDGASVPSSIDAANEELDRRARDFMSKSEDDITLTKAYEQVLTNDPELRARLYS